MIFEFVYFYIIVFCLDFHWGKLYLRKWGRKWNENKGKGKEPCMMEPAANWSRFSRRHEDGGTTTAMRPLYLFTLNECTNVRSRSWLEGWLIWVGGQWRTKDQNFIWTGSWGSRLAPSSKATAVAPLAIVIVSYQHIRLVCVRVLLFIGLMFQPNREPGSIVRLRKTFNIFDDKRKEEIKSWGFALKHLHFPVISQKQVVFYFITSPTKSYLARQDKQKRHFPPLCLF